MQSFFTERLARQLQASPRTVAAYRDSFRLLLGYLRDQIGKQPSFWASRISTQRSSAPSSTTSKPTVTTAPRTRNARLGAIRSLFRYAALQHPEHAALIQQVLAIPQKRYDRKMVSFLTAAEIDALIAAPDSSRWEGRRARALILMAVQTGLRLSELIGVNCGDVTLGTGAHVICEGKGRKQRAVPLTGPTDAVLQVWMDERAGRPEDPLFPTGTGRRLSRDAVERRVTTHAATAIRRCPSIASKRLSPRVLRHSCAMSLLHAGVDTTVIALRLGHADIRSTQMYLHADLTIKERALALTAPASAPPGRYRPPDALLAFLESL